MDLKPGITIGNGKYQLTGRLREGGQAEVWEAHQMGMADFSKDVVLKCVHVEGDNEIDMQQSLLREARLAARLQHPNIVEIYDIGEEQDLVYIAMERIQGLDLEMLLQHRQHKSNAAFPWAVAATVMMEVCKGLHYAHSHTDRDGTQLHLVHRDLKPSNILLTGTGYVKVIDFGIAKATNVPSSGDETSAGRIKGTPSYMSPEQVLSRPLDARSDLFALGSILYELCCGYRAFESDDVFSIMMLVSQGKPEPLGRWVRDLPPEFEALIFRLLAKDPNERFQNAREVQRAIDKILRQYNQFIDQEDLAAFYKEATTEEDDDIGALVESLAAQREQGALDTDPRGADNSTTTESQAIPANTPAVSAASTSLGSSAAPIASGPSVLSKSPPPSAPFASSAPFAPFASSAPPVSSASLPPFASSASAAPSVASASSVSSVVSTYHSSSMPQNSPDLRGLLPDDAPEEATIAALQTAPGSPLMLYSLPSEHGDTTALVGDISFSDILDDVEPTLANKARSQPRNNNAEGATPPHSAPSDAPSWGHASSDAGLRQVPVASSKTQVVEPSEELLAIQQADKEAKSRSDAEKSLRQAAEAKALPSNGSLPAQPVGRTFPTSASDLPSVPPSQRPLSNDVQRPNRLRLWGTILVLVVILGAIVFAFVLMLPRPTAVTHTDNGEPQILQPSTGREPSPPQIPTKRSFPVISKKKRVVGTMLVTSQPSVWVYWMKRGTSVRLGSSGEAVTVNAGQQKLCFLQQQDATKRQCKTLTLQPNTLFRLTLAW